MKRLLRKIRDRAMQLYYRRNYYLAQVFRPTVPYRPLSDIPDGFRVHRVGKTGICLVDGFCTSGEAGMIIEKARPLLSRSGVNEGGKTVSSGGRTSATALVFDQGRQDPDLLPVMRRAAMLVGLPYTHAEAVFVTRYSEGEFYKAHVDYGDNFHVDRLYTVLIYLNDLADDQGGGTVFPYLKVGVRPRLGRAVSWTNMNPDGSVHAETAHAAMPVENGGEKWTIQLWFHAYEMFRSSGTVDRQSGACEGVALTGSEALPEGAWIAAGHSDMATES